MIRKITPKIIDVAREAGVSTATVSRTLSQPERVNVETRQRVLAAVEKTGYRINQAARSLRQQLGSAVLVLVPNLGNPFFSQILSGIEETFYGTEYNVLIADSLGRNDAKDLLAEYLLSTHADGIIILDGQVSARAREWIQQNAAKRNVVFACEWVEDFDLPVIRSNNRQGAAAAIRHLHSLGHRKIAHVTGPKDNVLTLARREGVLQERERLDLPMREEWVIRGDFSLESGYQAAEQIIAMNERPTSVFCASDQMAFGLISGLHAAGIRVPEDISVLGFDDVELAAFYVPRLTTIRQNRRALGTKAAQRVLASMREEIKAGACQDYVVEVELVVRDSCAPCPIVTS